MQKIVFIVTSLNSGGIENYLLRFLKHYEGAFEPYIFCKNGCNGELKEDYAKIRNITLCDGGLGYINPVLFLRFKGLLSTILPDCICDFTGNFAGVPLFLARLVGVKKRIAFYRGSTNHFRVSLFRSAYSYLMKGLVKAYSTKILANSNAALVNFFGANYIYNNKYLVINNGIDASDFLFDRSSLRKMYGIAENKFVVCHVGRYDSSKNHETILKVAVKICQSDADVHFILCGKSVDIKLKDSINEYNLNDRIHLLGYTRNVVQVLNSADCFYFPSVTEGQPNALIEALVVGLPFVASNIDPIKEILPKKYHVQLINPYCIDGAVDKIMQIKRYPMLRSDLNLSHWAIEKFNAKVLFSYFYNCLIFADK